LKIWKYALQLTQLQTVALPVGFKLLTVQMQGPEITLWALVDPVADRREVSFLIIGTGHDIPNTYGITGRIHAGTV